MPKSKYILEYLNSSQQNKAWLNIYKHMKNRHMFGMLLGALGYLFIGNGLCNMYDTYSIIQKPINPTKEDIKLSHFPKIGIKLGIRSKGRCEYI